MSKWQTLHIGIDNELAQAWDILLELGVSEATLRTVTNINGYNLTSLEDILYSDFGYRSFDQLEEENGRYQ